MQAHHLFQSEHEVHVVDRLSARALEQVVDHGNDEQTVVYLLQEEQALVGVDHLLEIRILVRDEGKRMILIIRLVKPLDLRELDLAIQVSRGEDPSREVAPHGDEVDPALEAVLQLAKALLDLGQVLVREGLVDGDVVVAPAEMGRGRGFDARSRGSRDGVDMQVVVEHQMFRQGQDGQLDAGGEAARVGHVARLHDLLAVQLGESVDEIMLRALQAIVHREVDDPHVGGHLVALHELACIAMGGTEEKDIDLVQWEGAGEAQIGLPIKPLVDVRDPVAGVARAVDERDLHLRVVEQEADQLARRISRSAYDTRLDHIFSSLWFV